jgi:uncharacterized protein (TIGR03437 family)
MAHITPNGKAGYIRIIAIAASFLIFSSAVFGQSCSAGSTTPQVHAEGLAEQLGNIGITCTGGTAGNTVSSILQIQIPTNITNRVDTSGNLTGITVTGAIADPPTLNAAGSVVFGSVQYLVPTPSNQAVVITISGLRAAIGTITAGTGAPFLYGTIVAPSLGITNNVPLALASFAPTMLSSSVNYGIPCLGSSLPSMVTFPNLLASGTSVSTVRITEASRGAFTPLVPGTGADFGVRFLVKLSGYGPNAQVYVPDVIVGSNGTLPTSGGDYNSTPNGGTYTPVPGLHYLLLARVAGADATGAGGTLVAGIPNAVTSYASVAPVTLVNGAGSATYEVIDANSNVINSAQIPVFVGVPATSCTTIQTNTLGATLAPASTVSVATGTDPIPRYVAATPASDCTFFSDCAATYFPVLLVSPATIPLSTSSLGQAATGYITVMNGGSSQLSFTATTTYQTATNQSVANWLSINGITGSSVPGIVDPSAGINASGLLLSASPAALLIPGTYQATVTINAGSAGTFAVPVTLTVGPAGPVIQGVVNAANSQKGPITAGSFAAIYGLNLAPKTSKLVTVTVNSIQAVVSYDSPTQINILVPAGVASASTVAVTATVDGVASNNFPVTLVANAPAVFSPGILNQNNTVNLASAPASLNDEIQIFLTGLSTTSTPPVTVNIGNQALTGTQIIYAGAVPSVLGLEQVNVQVPTALTFTGNSAPLTICVPGSGSQPVCSAPVQLYLH